MANTPFVLWPDDIFMTYEVVAHSGHDILWLSTLGVPSEPVKMSWSLSWEKVSYSFRSHSINYLKIFGRIIYSQEVAKMYRRHPMYSSPNSSNSPNYFAIWQKNFYQSVHMTEWELQCPTYLVCPELRGFPEHGTFSLKTSPRQIGTS